MEGRGPSSVLCVLYVRVVHILEDESNAQKEKQTKPCGVLHPENDSV
jgi:hypothetical protein